MTVEDNKATVRAFYQTALNDRDADAAVPYVGSSYRQHSPLVEDGYGGLRKYLDWIRANFQKLHNDCGGGAAGAMGIWARSVT
jgi:predicted SnoaL-like aldol condensation-catalyzing enzyme